MDGNGPASSSFSFGMIEGFEIQRLLGQGATAQVFAASRRADGESVALKVLHPGLAGNAEALRRIAAEVRAVSAFRHPNIVRVRESFLDRHPPFVAYELIEGVPLSDYQARLPY